MQDTCVVYCITRVNIARCNLCARAKVKGHIKLKIEEHTSVGKLVEPMSLISAQFYHIPGRYERVCVGWHCAKVKGHAKVKNRKNLE